MLKPRSQAGATSTAAPEPGFRESTAAPGTRPIVQSSAEPGTPVDVTWGEELFQPVQYHALRVGPFRATTVVRAGESVADATYRLWCALNEVAMRIRDEKAAEYLRAMESIAARTR